MNAVLAAVGYLLLGGAVLAHIFGRITTPAFGLLWTVGMGVSCIRFAALGAWFSFWCGLASMLLIAGVWTADRRRQARTGANG
jgi:hypothetical protein